MKDEEIVALYFARDDQAVVQTDQKYGRRIIFHKPVHAFHALVKIRRHYEKGDRGIPRPQHEKGKNDKNLPVVTERGINVQTDREFDRVVPEKIAKKE